MFALISFDFSPSDDEHQGSCNVYDDFESLELIHLTLEVGPHSDAIRQELLFYEPQWIEELEKNSSLETKRQRNTRKK